MRHFVFAFIAVLISSSAFAQHETSLESEQPLKVAVRVNAPFVIEHGNQQYKGLAVQLWQDIADRLNVTYELHPLPLEEVITGVERGDYDLGLGALTITSARESRLDFSQPFINGGLAIAVPVNNESTWWAMTKRFVSFDFLYIIMILSLVLFLAGALVWYFERKENPDEFSEQPLKGLGAGFWWAAVTMTTVGYGDKSPRSLGGRAVSLIWMFTCVIIISSFTASIASSLTVAKFQSKVSSVEDLGNARVATIGVSATARWLDDKNIGYESVTDLNTALAKLNRGQLDAVVYDEPIIRYQIRTQSYNNVRVLPDRVLSQDYGFVLPQGSALRESINRELLAIIQTETWRQELNRYLGQ